MKVTVTVTARHAHFTDAMKDIARQKAQHLQHYFDHLIKIEVILDLQSDKGYAVEMIAKGARDHVFVSHASAETALAALDAVVGKMERQLVKYKEKLYDKHEGAHLQRKTAGGERGGGDVWW